MTMIIYYQYNRIEGKRTTNLSLLIFSHCSAHEQSQRGERKGNPGFWNRILHSMCACDAEAERIHAINRMDRLKTKFSSRQETKLRERFQKEWILSHIAYEKFSF